MQGVLEQHFKEKFNRLFAHLLPPGEERLVTDDDIRSLMFGDYMTSGETRSYDEVQDMEKLREVRDPALPLVPTLSLIFCGPGLEDCVCCGQVMEHYLEEYNTMSKAPMDLVLFRFAIEHMSRLCRVIKQPNGHCLCVGECALTTALATKWDNPGEGALVFSGSKLDCLLCSKQTQGPSKTLC